MPVAPRLFGIPARDAPVVAVLRRGPSSWSHVARWDVEALTYEPGAWLRGTLYPQRCDLSPDGRFLCTFTLKASADWAPGATYVSVSRLPWLHALVAWGTGGTWTRGLHFTEPGGAVELVGSPDEGTADELPFGLSAVRPASYAVERRRGWVESPDTPGRADGDAWDERRGDAITMQKDSPRRDGSRLWVRGSYAAFRSFDTRWYGAPAYGIDGPGGARLLDGVQWADWAPDGRLLLATATGRLQVLDGTTVVWDRDVAAEQPDPRPPPAEALHW